MFFYVGALVLAFFSGIFLPMLLGLPWWIALLAIPILVLTRIAITERDKAQKLMDIGNGTIIGLFVLKIVL